MTKHEKEHIPETHALIISEPNVQNINYFHQVLYRHRTIPNLKWKVVVSSKINLAHSENYMQSTIQNKEYITGGSARFFG